MPRCPELAGIPEAAGAFSRSEVARRAEIRGERRQHHSMESTQGASLKLLPPRVFRLVFPAISPIAAKMDNPQQPHAAIPAREPGSRDLCGGELRRVAAGDYPFWTGWAKLRETETILKFPTLVRDPHGGEMGTGRPGSPPVARFPSAKITRGHGDSRKSGAPREKI